MLPALPKPGQTEGKIILSPRQIKKETDRRWEAGERTCHICREEISNRSNYCLDHVNPASGVGARRDSQSKNLKPAHVWPCNWMKGSKRNYEPKRSLEASKGDS